MTTLAFWILFCGIQFCIGICGLIIDSKIKDEGFDITIGIIGVLSVILCGGGLIALICTSNPTVTIVPLYNWCIYFLTIGYIILVACGYLSENYTPPSKRSYFDDYYELKHKYSNLEKEYKKLQQDLKEIEKYHHKEIEDIIKHKPLFEYQPTNIKLHII